MDWSTKVVQAVCPGIHLARKNRQAARPGADGSLHTTGSQAASLSGELGKMAITLQSDLGQKNASRAFTWPEWGSTEQSHRPRRLDQLPQGHKKTPEPYKPWCVSTELVDTSLILLLGQLRSLKHPQRPNIFSPSPLCLKMLVSFCKARCRLRRTKLWQIKLQHPENSLQDLTDVRYKPTRPWIYFMHLMKRLHGQVFSIEGHWSDWCRKRPWPHHNTFDFTGCLCLPNTAKCFSNPYEARGPRQSVCHSKTPEPDWQYKEQLARSLHVWCLQLALLFQLRTHPSRVYQSYHVLGSLVNINVIVSWASLLRDITLYWASNTRRRVRICMDMSIWSKDGGERRKR